MAPDSVTTGVSALEWANGIVGVSGALIAFVALATSKRSARAAESANDISENANTLAKDANRVAEHALKLQLDASQLRIVVKPQMLRAIGDGEDMRPRPVVEVINLSAFPVTIEKIVWKLNRKQKPWLFWKNPTVTAPFGRLPARLPSRESLTAVGTPDTFRTEENLDDIAAAVVFTACGESVEGMTDQWRAFCEDRRKNQETCGTSDGVA